MNNNYWLPQVSEEAWPAPSVSAQGEGRRGQRGHLPVQTPRQKQPTQQNHGTRLNNSHTHCHHLANNHNSHQFYDIVKNDAKYKKNHLVSEVLCKEHSNEHQ